MNSVEILNTETNEVRIYEMDETSGSEFSSFIWEEGNFACDCNRHLFFERAAGNDPEYDEGPCGDTRYVVLSIKSPDGALLYAEPRLRSASSTEPLGPTTPSDRAS